MKKHRSRDAVQKLKYYTKNLGIFPNLEAMGSYDDFSQTVFVDYLDKKAYLELLSNFQAYDTQDNTKQKALQQNYESISRFYSTCVHEFTHWLDHTSTLWGQRQLILIYNAINAWTNQNEDDFWRIMLANSERQRARLATYYTEEYQVVKQESVVTPWQYNFGSGLEFGIDGRPRPDRPFIFMVFLDSNNQRICRVPLSVVSLTEANATYAEFRVKIQGLSMLSNDFRVVEQARLFREIKMDLYNSKLAIYSNATHGLANSVGIDEIFKAYEFSSALATLCLNLSKNLFHLLVEPEEFSILGDRVKALKELEDPGFAFFTIVRQAPKYYDGLSVESWLEEALSNSGLPNIETIYNLVYAQMEEIETQILNGRYSNQLKSLLSIGRHNFTQRGMWGQNVISMENLVRTSMILPPVVLGDECVVPVTPTTIPIGQRDMEQWIEQIVDIEISIDRFIQACRF